MNLLANVGQRYSYESLRSSGKDREKTTIFSKRPTLLLFCCHGGTYKPGVPKLSAIKIQRLISPPITTSPKHALCQHLNFSSSYPKSLAVKSSLRSTHLALHEHVEELVARLLGVPFHAEMTQVVVRNAEARQVPDAGALVVEPPALGAGDEVKELLCLRGGHG